MNLHNQIAFVKAHIASLLAAHPELEGDADLCADMLEGETDITVILSRLTEIALEAAAMGEAIKLRGQALAARQSRFEVKEAATRRLILSVMARANLAKMQLTEATLSIRHVDPKPIVNDVLALPEHCVRIERKADMKAIKADFDAGISIPGTSMSNGYSSLTIRTK